MYNFRCSNLDFIDWSMDFEILMKFVFQEPSTLCLISEISSALKNVISYKDLSEVVNRISFDPLVCATRTLTIDDVTVDEYSMPLVPPDASSSLPANIYADGNCLPRAASLFAYHTEDCHEELRYRIIQELVQNSEYYLSEALNFGGGTKAAQTFAMFSEFFTAESFLKKSVQTIFEEETLSICMCGTYMGAWQIAALAAVLQRPVRSVYPVYAGATVRKDLHRMFYPRGEITGDQGEAMEVLWTNTQGVDLKPREWRPNHFVLLVHS